MDNLKRMVTAAAVVALASQMYIRLFGYDFNVSAAIILFPIFLTVFKNLNPSKTGVLTGIFVYLLRAGVHMAQYGEYTSVAQLQFPEALFYVIYGFLYQALNDMEPTANEKRFFVNIVLCDFIANIVEIYVRVVGGILEYDFELVGLLFVVALLRAFIVLVIIFALKHYRMLILKQHHEERYRKLLWIISQLKTEMYWMQKNMDNIEHVMSNAYSLFENITLQQDAEKWPQMAVDIAKDVHEIKKEYGLMFRGVEEIIENKLNDPGMHFDDMLKILKDSMAVEAATKGQKTLLEFKSSTDFYTEKHYQLMSIFRNLIVNAMEAIDDLAKGRIVFSHTCTDSHHVFSVLDNGHGIDEAERELIFSPGFSTKIDYSTGYINRGLGLSIVKDIVEKEFQGKLELDSRPGFGTKFTVFIERNKVEV